MLNCGSECGSSVGLGQWGRKGGAGLQGQEQWGWLRGRDGGAGLWVRMLGRDRWGRAVGPGTDCLGCEAGVRTAGRTAVGMGFGSCCVLEQRGRSADRNSGVGTVRPDCVSSCGSGQ